jgi:hypothetical protein
MNLLFSSNADCAVNRGGFGRQLSKNHKKSADKAAGSAPETSLHALIWVVF